MNNRAISRKPVSSLILVCVFTLYLILGEREAYSANDYHEAEQRGQVVMSGSLLAQTDFVQPHKPVCLQGI